MHLFSVMLLSAFAVCYLGVAMAETPTGTFDHADLTFDLKCPNPPFGSTEPAPETCGCSNLCLYSMLWNQQNYEGNPFPDTSNTDPKAPDVYMLPCVQANIRDFCRTLCTKFTVDRSVIKDKKAVYMNPPDVCKTAFALNSIAAEMVEPVQVYCFGIINAYIPPFETKKCGEYGSYQLCLMDKYSKNSINFTDPSKIGKALSVQDMYLETPAECKQQNGNRFSMICLAADPRTISFYDPAVKKRFVGGPVNEDDEFEVDQPDLAPGNDGIPTPGGRGGKYGYIKSNYLP